MTGKWIRLLCIVAAGMIGWGGSGHAAENALKRSHITAQGPPWDKGARKFMFVAQAGAPLIVSFWPDLSLWLPRVMK